MTAIPTLTTERLVLRAAVLADFEPYASVLTSERARYMDGPFGRVEAWNQFGASVGSWALLGHGCLSIADRASGTYCGEVGLNRPVHFPENELGWFVVPEREGQGIALEAAQAARDWAFAALGWTTLVSYVGPENTRSIRLAERLGATRDPKAATPNGEGCLVFRHRSPGAVQ
jgi:RimJ/RimL family protein N-acetyltransferase